MDDYVLTITFHGTDLYAGGFSQTSGGIETNFIAKWDGTQWSSLYSPMFGPEDRASVHAIAFIGDYMYAAGNYSISGPPSPYDLQNIAKWDGTEWSEVGMGIQGYQYYEIVYTLSVMGSTLFSGGYFCRSGVNYLHNIAKFDGTQWVQFGNGFGEGMDTWVHSMTVIRNDIYAVGNFTSAGDIAAYHVAKWDGTQWTSVGGGTNGYEGVKAMTFLNGDLYAGGSFTKAGNDSVNRFAKWTGNHWEGF